MSLSPTTDRPRTFLPTAQLVHCQRSQLLRPQSFMIMVGRRLNKIAPTARNAAPRTTTLIHAQSVQMWRTVTKTVRVFIGLLPTNTNAVWGDL
jgi:hypothetical protein